MKPVEIEFLMKDGLTPGLKKAGSIVRQFSGEASAELKEVSESLKLQREHVSRLENELKELEKSFKTAAPGEEWNKAKLRIEEIRKELEDEKTGLESLIDKERQLKDESEKSDVSLRQQLRNLTQEIASLMVAYARLSDEERTSAEGKALQRHIADLTEQAGILRDAMGDTTAAISNAASDTRGFDQLSGALQVTVDAFGLATAGAKMFGVSQESLAEIQTKLQAAIVASNALSSIQNNLQKQSALMQGINIIQTKSATAAENIKTAAQGRGIIATKAATVAQAALNTVANANPYVLLAVAITTVVGALWAFSAANKESKKKAEEMKDSLNSLIDAKERAATAAERLKSAYDEVNSTMVSERSEMELNIARTKEFKGTKEEEKEIVSQLNNKYGETMGYFSSVSDWYNALISNSEAYCQQMIIEARTRSLANQMAQAEQDKYNIIYDENGNKRKYSTTRQVEQSIVGYAPNYGSAGGAHPIYENKEILGSSDLDKAQKAVNDITANINNLKRQMLSEIEKVNSVKYNVKGSPTKPSSSPSATSSNDPQKDDRLEYERKAAGELQQLRWKNQQTEIDQMDAGAEKQRKQIALNYEKQMAEIQEQEDRWKEAQKGELTKDQSETIAEALRLANQGMQNAIRDVEKDEVAKSREKLNKLLEQYKDFDQRRRDIETSHKADMEVLNAELARLEGEGLDTTAVKSAISARKEAYRSSIASLEGEILQASDFYDKLFGTVSDRGYKVLKDFYAQAKETLENAKIDGDGVNISIPVKDADGKFVKKAVKITVDEYRRMLKQIQDIQKQLEKDNPFAAFRTSWSELNKTIKEDGDVSGALKDLNSKGKEVTNTIRGWGESLGSVFGDNFKNSMNEILTFCDGAMDMGTGIAQIWSGDIVGGITSALSGLSSIISLFTSWKEKMEEMKREWYIAEIETNRALRERSAEYAANRSEISDIIKDVELLNWLIEKGYAKPSSVSVWEAESSALDEYMDNLRKESVVYDELWSKLQGSQGHYEWGNSLNGGSATWSLKGASADMIELWYNQNKLSDEAKAYYEAWVDSGKSIEDLIDKINECKSSMREMVMGVSFDSFLSNAASALKKMRGDVSELGKFTEDTLAEAILNGFMYRDLANVLEPLYNELSDAFIDGTADAAYLENWRRRFEEIMSAAGDRLDVIADAAGIDLDSSSGTSQSGKAGSYTAMSQDQGTKLEGIGTSIQMHTASIDEKMEDVSEKMSQAAERLRKIEENTGRTADTLDEVKDEIKKIIRDGIKTR